MDRRVGLLYYFIMLLAIGYIFGYVIVYRKAYLETQDAEGLVATKMKGAAFGNSSYGLRYYDIADMHYPNNEKSSIFLATRVYIERGEEQEYCDSPSKQGCHVDTDCTSHHYPGINGICRNSTCQYLQWCSSHGHTHQLEGVENVTIWFKASINFDKLDKDVYYSTIQNPRPVWYTGNNENANLFSVKQILEKAGIQDISEIAENGTMIEVNVEWQCRIGAEVPCTTQLTSRRLDTKGGFNLIRPVYSRINGRTQRDIYKMNGIRFFVRSIGSGRKVSIVNIILQCSSCLVLFGLAKIIANTLLLYILPAKEVYRRYVVEDKKLGSSGRESLPNSPLSPRVVGE